MSFAGRLRWPVAYSPLRGCARRAALPAAKIHRRSEPSYLRISSKNNHGYLLLEALVYMALLTVVLGLAYAAYWRCSDNSKRLHENADDILAAVNAGERWRDDVRTSRETVVRPQGIDLVQSGDTIEYRFDQEAVWRRSTQTGRTIRLLGKVKSSAMQLEARRQVRAWRWEVELQSRKAAPFLRPLFTFEAVPAP